MTIKQMAITGILLVVQAPCAVLLAFLMSGPCPRGDMSLAQLLVFSGLLGGLAGIVFLIVAVVKATRGRAGRSPDGDQHNTAP